MMGTVTMTLFLILEKHMLVDEVCNKAKKEKEAEEDRDEVEEEGTSEPQQHEYKNGSNNKATRAAATTATASTRFSVQTGQIYVCRPAKAISGMVQPSENTSFMATVLSAYVRLVSVFCVSVGLLQTKLQ